MSERKKKGASYRGKPRGNRGSGRGGGRGRGTGGSSSGFGRVPRQEFSWTKDPNSTEITIIEPSDLSKSAHSKRQQTTLHEPDVEYVIEKELLKQIAEDFSDSSEEDEEDEEDSEEELEMVTEAVHFELNEIDKDDVDDIEDVSEDEESGEDGEFLDSEEDEEDGDELNQVVLDYLLNSNLSDDDSEEGHLTLQTRALRIYENFPMDSLSKSTEIVEENKPSTNPSSTKKKLTTEEKYRPFLNDKKQEKRIARLKQKLLKKKWVNGGTIYDQEEKVEQVETVSEEAPHRINKKGIKRRKKGKIDTAIPIRIVEDLPVKKELKDNEKTPEGEDKLYFGKKKPIVDSPASQSTSEVELKRKDLFSLKDLYYINDIILDFIANTFLDSMPFSPFSKMQHAQIRMLAKEYNLKFSVLSSGKRKYTQITKTRRTFIPDPERIANMMPILLLKQKTDLPEMPDDILKPRKKKGKGKSNKTPPKGGKRAASNAMSPLVSGTRVAEGAKPIGENNLGNIMLRSMGWTGGPLGTGSTGEGIVDPITAVIKHNRKGLGL